MAINPTFTGPDGTNRQTWVFTTTRSQRFFSGTIDPDTAYMEVSVYGQAFTADPNLVSFEGASFTVPNPTAYPQGLRLLPGLNSIRVRSILTNGATTDAATADVTLVQSEGQEGVFPVPSGISAERLDGAVKIIIRSSEQVDNLIGHNFYASPQTGGGTVGYYQINVSTILASDAEYLNVEESIGTLVVDSAIFVEEAGSGVVPQLGFRYRGDQASLDQPTNTLEAAFDEVIPFPVFPDAGNLPTLRSTVNLSTLTKTFFYTFTHDRYGSTTSKYPTLPNGLLASVPQTDPIYYAATSVYYDPLTNLESETALSAEVSGIPLAVTPAIGTFPIATRQEVTQDLISSIYRTNPDISVVPGSVIRDTFIDPMASESERLRYIMDFVHRAQSFSTLLTIDDPNLTGVSVPVRQSTYKLALAQAFRLTDLNQVQAIIDMAFDKRASDLGQVRLAGTQAQGEVTFYLTSLPTQTILLPIGTSCTGGGTTFTTTSSVTFDPNNIAPYFNPATGQYAAKAFVRAVDVGPNGNLPSRAITTVNVPNVRVYNEAPTFGGQAAEGNYALAVRCARALASVDTSTYQGYVQTAASIAGVLEADIISAGSPYMMRDVNPTTGQHMGGKVDVWVRGTQLGTVSDTFAFSYENLYGVLFEVVGPVADLTFRAVLTDPTTGQSRLSVNNPLTEMLNFPANTPPLGLHNLTRGYDFVLTDIQYLSFDTIKLSATYNDPTNLSLADILTGDFRLRTSFEYKFSRQPVSTIVEVNGNPNATGLVDSTQYALYKLESPLLLGESSFANDYIQFSTPDPTGTLGQVLTVTGEQHVLIGNFTERLNLLGQNPLTIQVWNLDRSIQYAPVGPYVAAPDFRIISPENPETEAFSIQRTEQSTIASGETVLVDYSYNENFSVTYTTNSVIGVAQNNLDAKRSLTADVVAKQANPLILDIDATVVLQQGQSSSVIDPLIRASILNLILNGGMGQGIRQADVISAIDRVNGVSYPVVPLTKMTLADETMITGEALVTSTEGTTTLIASWTTATVDVRLILDPLTYATVMGGGSTTRYRAVTQNDVDMTLLDQLPNTAGQPLNTAANQAFIIGSEGLDIPGYSDDATLLPQAASYPRWFQLEPLVTAGTATLAEQAEFVRLTGQLQSEVLTLRQEITANRVLITLATGTNPQSNQYAVTYFVFGDSGAKDIEATAFDFVSPGTVNLTYDSDRQTNRRTFILSGANTIAV